MSAIQRLNQDFEVFLKLIKMTGRLKKFFIVPTQSVGTINKFRVFRAFRGQLIIAA
jgi:hypothetical protein